MRKTIFLLLLIGSCAEVFSQNEKFPQTLTAGVEFRPIFPADFLNTGKQEVANSEYGLTVSPKFGFSAGMVIRYGFHKRFALETGLSFVQRNYNLSVHRDSVNNSPFYDARPEYNSKTDFTIIGFDLDDSAHEASPMCAI